MAIMYDGRIATFMDQLVDSQTNLVRFRTLIETHSFLLRHGFHLASEEKYGPEGGWQLFYHSGGFQASGEGMIVRIKTHGETMDKKYRQFKPHLSVTWQKGRSKLGEEFLDNTHEVGKFNPSGVLESKGQPRGSNANKKSWADRTHPLFPGFESSCETNPMGLYGAEALCDSGPTA